MIGHDTATPDGVVGEQSGGDWRYYLPDALGSVRQSVDAAGTLVAAREWTPYGVEVGDAQDGLGYAGEWRDAAVGLQYLRARWYHPGTGRFISRDPWEGDDGRSQSLNGWAYVEGNPIRLVDPSGLTWDAETRAFVSHYKAYFLQSAARHNAIPTMDQNGFAGLIAATIADERRMGNIPQDDFWHGRFMQGGENTVIYFGCIVSGRSLKEVCDLTNNDTRDIGRCLTYLFSNTIPEGRPLDTLASVGIGNIKLATATRLLKGLSGYEGADAPPVTVSPLQFNEPLFDDRAINIANPFAASCAAGTCDYDPSTNAVAYQNLGRLLSAAPINIEFAAAILEEGALMTLNAGEQPSAFASIMWYKHSVATHEDISSLIEYANLGHVLANVDQALNVWGLSTTWDWHVWDIEPHWHRSRIYKAWKEQYGP